MANPLQGKVSKAHIEAKGFDADTVISFEVAKQFYQDGYRFCVRYLSRGTEQSGDLSRQEAQNIIDSGLALMAVQHVRLPGWHPSGDLGHSDGTAAGVNARSVGFPEGVNIWCDLEGIMNLTPVGDVTSYCNQWYDAVFDFGFTPGLYVGAGCLLNSSQLYNDLKFQHYWKSESEVPDVEKRGYQLVQRFHGEPVNGIGIDLDQTQDDNLGGQALWFHL